MLSFTERMYLNIEIDDHSENHRLFESDNYYIKAVFPYSFLSPVT